MLKYIQFEKFESLKKGPRRQFTATVETHHEKAEGLSLDKAPIHKV